jgi:hypothetical protein
MKLNINTNWLHLSFTATLLTESESDPAGGQGAEESEIRQDSNKRTASNFPARVVKSMWIGRMEQIQSSQSRLHKIPISNR